MSKIKHFSILMLLVAVSSIAFSSCSKDDDSRDPANNLKSVDGTEWIATKATITFRNGKYTIDCAIPGTGTYKQDGRKITFDGQKVSIGGGYVTLKSGEISKYGDSMTISFQDASYWDTGEIEQLKFVYNILKD